jgi:hypothetical protein
MAYRVPQASAHPARPDHRCAPRSAARHNTQNNVLARNVLIAGASLGAVSLISAGLLLFGAQGPVASPFASSDAHSALKVALVDAAAPVVAQRDPRAAVLTSEALMTFAARTDTHDSVSRDTTVRDKTPSRRYEVASAGPDGGFDAAPAAAPKPLPIRLPMARPAQRDAVLASIPFPIPAPREHTTHQVLAYADTADTLTTGSLGVREISEPAHKVAVVPVVRVPLKPARPLTPHEKLFGTAGTPIVRLASLTPNDNLHLDMRDASPGELPHAPYDNRTAVYVISARKVYMPDGREFEAHSGLGDKMDDPRFVNVRMRGATPPHVYDLTLRESLFHGVEAIRMTPLGGDGAIFGRDGILAHTYMLGPNGQSNGCVSFRDYDAFLHAFKQGKVDRLAVIGKLD